MNTIPNPDNWMDVVTIIVVTAMLAVPSWFAARNHKAIRSVDRKTDAIVGSAVNGHDNPLRADIDKLTAAVTRIEGNVTRIEGKVDRLESQMNDAREDSTAEKAVRRAENRELREDVDARFRALNQRMD